MNNKSFSDLLIRLATLLEIKGENVFKIKAYQKAAENISTLSEDIQKLNDENRLSEIPGVGEAIRFKIGEWLKSGHVKAYDELTKEIPESVLELVDIPSVGPKKAKLFYDKLKVKSLEDLRKAVEAGKLNGLEGIKEKTIQNIIDGIKIVKQGQSRMNLAAATVAAEEVIVQLKKMREVKRIELSGSLRRGSESVGDIDILIDSDNSKKVMDVFVGLPFVKSVNAHGETKSSILTRNNVQIDLRVVKPDEFGAALLYFTGSKNFNVKLRQLAQKKDMKVNEYGVFSVKGSSEELLASKTEEECLKVLGLAYIPPELREDWGEEKIFSGQAIPKLIEQKDLKGELHVHSTYSDGKNTIEEMVQAALDMGYQYLAISDHSPKLKVAGGVSIEDLKRKRKEIDGLNKKYKNFKILFGTEVEIDIEGNLDYNEGVLNDFDVVVASVHSHFDLDSDKQTKRIIRAIENKAVNLIGHPFGTHLGKREPMAMDFKEICRAAVSCNVALEINSFPIRLDLNSSNVYFAKNQGVKLAVNSDSHSVEHLKYIQYGISIARRGWLTSSDVINTWKLNELLKFLGRS